MTPSKMNTRILVIDDEESVRDSFRTVLAPPREDDGTMAAAASVLFDEGTETRANPASLPFEVDVACNGKEGLWMVEAAVAKALPYAAIFIDIRMPGWDGLETAEHIRKVDQRAELVFVTAYSDHSIETIIEHVGPNIGYFVKPFLTDEVKQLSTKLVLEWNKARELEELVKTVTSLRGDAKDMDRLVQHFLSEICAFLDTTSAALLRIQPDGQVRFYVGVGRLQDATSTQKIVDEARESLSKTGVIMLADGTVCLPLHEFGIAIAMSGKTTLTPDRRFLLEVFLEHAALAIRNSEMRQRLLEREHMAAVGEALAYVLHDLRNPLGAAQWMLKLVSEGKTRNQEEALTRIDRQIGRALDIVRDTLHFCRGGVQVAPQDILLGPVLEDTLLPWRMDLERRGIELHAEIPLDLRLRADPSWFERVLGNLIKNAAEALVGVSAPRVELAAAPVEGGVEIRVCDNGPGIPSEIGAHLFEPFATYGKAEGIGFGLAIVKRVMDAHGGSARFERQGETTCFGLYFPNHAPAPSETPSP